MNKQNKKYCFVAMAIIFLCSISTTAYAQQPIKTACIVAKDNSSNIDHRLCHSYISGFLEGALLTDAAIIDNFINEKSNFFQRAYRTRAATGKETLPVTYLAKFCLPKSEPFTKIVDSIIDNLDSLTLRSNTLNNEVYKTIKQIYPCKSSIP